MDILEKNVLGARAISSRLKRSIESGTYQDGEQLPTERELALSFSASRSTIRNALNQLEESGLVIRKIGSGTFVTFTGKQEFDVNSVIDQISPSQLIDARVGIERQMVRLAVIHASRLDLDKLGGIFDRMVMAENDRDEFSRLDTEFHLQIASSTGNPLIVHLYEQINDVRTHDQWKAMKDVILTPEQIREYNKYHLGILNGINQRDAATAIDAMNKHMELAHKDLIGVLDKL